MNDYFFSRTAGLQPAAFLKTADPFHRCSIKIFIVLLSLSLLSLGNDDIPVTIGRIYWEAFQG